MGGRDGTGRDGTGSGVVPEEEEEEEEEEDTEPLQTPGPQDNVSRAHSFACRTRYARHGHGTRNSISPLAPPTTDLPATAIIDRKINLPTSNRQ